MANNNKIFTTPYHKSNDNHQGKSNNSHFKQGSGNNNKTQGNNIVRNYSENGNLGLLFTRRYFNGLTMQLVENIDRKTEPVKYKNQQKSQSAYYKERNENLLRQARNFDEPQMMKSEVIDNIFTIELTTNYPGLLTGTGILHSTGHMGETKLGLMFDHTTGLPYLPGSSVKGLLRSMFPLRDHEKAQKYIEQANKDRSNEVELRKKAECLERQAAEKRKLITGLLNKKGFSVELVDDIERSIFDGEEIDNNGVSCFVPIRDIFFDAFPIESGEHGLLGLDYITPHKNEFSNPTPIHFLRIEPGVKIRFEFRLRDSMRLDKVLCEKETKLDLFRKILTTVGIGAKTNVGYGQLKSVD